MPLPKDFVATICLPLPRLISLPIPALATTMQFLNLMPNMRIQSLITRHFPTILYAALLSNETSPYIFSLSLCLSVLQRGQIHRVLIANQAK